MGGGGWQGAKCREGSESLLAGGDLHEGSEGLIRRGLLAGRVQRAGWEWVVCRGLIDRDGPVGWSGRLTMADSEWQRAGGGA